MPIIATASKPYALHPTGLAQCVCVDVVDVGMVEVPTYSDKEKARGPRLAHKVNIIWQSEELDEQGEPIQLRRRYTLSLDKKASLRRDLESWRGRPFTDEELKGFDLEKLIWANCFINVIHEQRDDKTYANVASISPLRKGVAHITPSASYVRVKDRPVEGQAEQHSDPGPAAPEEEEPVPF